MVFHPAPEAERVIGGFVPTLLTEHHDEETKRLTGLGAKLVNEAYLPPIRLTVFADPKSSDPAEGGYEPPMLRLPRDWRDDSVMRAGRGPQGLRAP
jgi:hypothetical protein